jgi:hypothetical protein
MKFILLLSLLIKDSSLFASAFTNQDYRSALDHFFSLFFARLLSSGLWPSAQQSVFLQDISTKASHPAPAQFEDLLPAAHWVPLPREAQVSSNGIGWHYFTYCFSFSFFLEVFLLSQFYSISITLGIN